LELLFHDHDLIVELKRREKRRRMGRRGRSQSKGFKEDNGTTQETGL